jgi:hypothetical protein
MTGYVEVAGSLNLLPALYALAAIIGLALLAILPWFVTAFWRLIRKRDQASCELMLPTDALGHWVFEPRTHLFREGK